LRKLQSPRELAVSALANRISIVVLLRRRRALPGDSQTVIVDFNINVLLLEPGKLERGSDDVFLRILVEIHSVNSKISHQQKNKENMVITHLGLRGRTAPSLLRLLSLR